MRHLKLKAWLESGLDGPDCLLVWQSTTASKHFSDLTNEIQTRLSAVTELSGFGFPKFKSTTLIFLNYQIKNFWGVHDLFWRVFFICQQSIFNLDSLFNTYQKQCFLS